jgi:hypothetical protein
MFQRRSAPQAVNRQKLGRKAMPAPFYLGWAVMAVVALGSVDILYRVAHQVMRGPHRVANKSEPAKQRFVPRPKSLAERERPEEMWF